MINKTKEAKMSDEKRTAEEIIEKLRQRNKEIAYRRILKAEGIPIIEGE